MEQLNEKQIEQVKALFDQWSMQGNAKIEASRLQLMSYQEQIKANQFLLDIKIKEFQQNIERLQQFYDKFNGEE